MLLHFSRLVKPEIVKYFGSSILLPLRHKIKSVTVEAAAYGQNKAPTPASTKGCEGSRPRTTESA